MIEVSEYDEQWPIMFDILRSKYSAALAGVDVVGIEHVGSTSVPGLAAKPIIDVDIIVTADQVQPAIEAMGRIGFESRGDLGIEHRWAFHAPSELPATNTYVVLDSSVALRNHLGVRDALRSDPALCAEYGELKHAIAAEVTDIEVYVERKSVFLSRVLARAGLAEDERRRIEEANRARDDRPGT